MKKRLKLRTEIKLLILITFVLSVGFSVINFLSISSFKREFYQKVETEAKLYQLLLIYNKRTELPPYFKLSNTPFKVGENWEVIGKLGNAFFLLDLNYLESQINRYALSLFLWEVPILVATILIVYRVVSFFLEREKRMKDMLRLFFMLYSHKLGNFLSLNRINLEILSQTCSSSRALSRLKRSYSLLEEDFKRSLKYVETLGGEEEEESSFDLAELLNSLVAKYRTFFPAKEVILSGGSIRVKAKRTEAESLLQLVVENAFKYSDKYVKVEIVKNKDSSKIRIENDVSGAPSGTGVGLKLSNFLAKRLGWELKIIPEEREFTVEILIK
ncbi:hypothetical protein [Thermovibrio sp.]